MSSNGGNHGYEGAAQSHGQGTFGDPNTSYYGPGLSSLLNSGMFQTRSDKDGRVGIVLGKYSKVNSLTKTYTDFDEF